MALSPAEIKRADIQSFRDVATALDGMATANNDMKTGVGRLPIAGDAWKGVSGDAAHHELDGFGKLLSGSAESKAAAAAKIRRAADEFEGVKQLLAKIEKDAANGGFTIDMATGKVTPPQGDYDKNELSYIQNTLRQLQQAGDAANADLAAAVKAAKEPPAGAGPSGALPITPNSAVKPDGVFGGVQNLATANPDGEPGATKAAAAAAGTDTQANYKEWYPKTPGSGDKLTIDPSKAGSLTGTVGALDKMPGAPKPQDGFGSGVAKQFLKGANERIDGTIDEVKSKAGLNGADKFAESWTNSAKGLEHQIERTLFPGAAMAEDAKNMIDQAVTSYQHPEKIPENIGKTTVDAAIAGTTVPLGGEGAFGRIGLEDASIAGRGGLPDTPVLPHDAPAAGHTPVDPPSAHPGPVADHSPPAVDHPAPSLDHSQPPPPQHHQPTPDAFDPSAGRHYASGDPHHPGGWPPGTPEPTWSKGDTEPGWKHINHNFDKDWMPYQEQIGGVERTPSGALPEWVQHDPDTGAPVAFDGHTHRGPQEVFLEAKDGFRGMAFAPDSTYWTGRAMKALEQVDRQLAALPPDARLEWHVSDPYGAFALRKLFIDNDIDGVEVIYTPTAPQGN
ncbi:Tox-REase-5 domain-containing protein [Mycobacteroides abscessus]|uniref:Tox-REase-5 domain-containing protein n=1 Tax=Mycobacteroides abscessus TaxID=36809 RepID=UPI00078C6997|nr:Tox-REase-5 domain-containing protein [Mycobacteroides abscessus]AMU73746.1 hypothetical protein A3O06_02965 [Mycobacteroides abscessus]ANO22685.1 hypothetical protein BAB79_02965 [Mycobacteroides abscessus]